MQLVVFAVGNESRGDDALGPILARRLEQLALSGVTVIQDFQLQIEHALDMAGQDLALFVDAGVGTPAPYRLDEIAPSPSRIPASHALEPDAVLAVAEQILPGGPPPSFVLCVRGESFELGEGLSAFGLANLETAWRALEALCRHPDPENWRQRAYNKLCY